MVMHRVLGIDVGAETIKLAELTRTRDDERWSWTGRDIVEHQKEPSSSLLTLLKKWDFENADQAAVTGRMSRLLALPRIPIKQAQISGLAHIFPDKEPMTLVSIGSHGFSVLEIRDKGSEVYRENSRCSQGTGNFLRQLVERFNLTIEEASRMCDRVENPAPLSGRCPVILKTDMTHLANKGESQDSILAGLYDAVCENVQVLIKPRVSPRTLVVIGGVARCGRIHRHFEKFGRKHDMKLQPLDNDDGLFVEALGCASIATQSDLPMPDLRALVKQPERQSFDRVPAFVDYLDKVKRLSAPEPKAVVEDTPLILGYDIGSTGSKAVAIDSVSGDAVWQGYINTNGAPVKAAQYLTDQFLSGPCGHNPVIAVGATGSGREIVGSLMTTCYGANNVFVLNEIAAHAEGALHYDPRVDTIFEIGGQDAKYIRLSLGRVIDSAMNEACSAGTGSFIEEQGKRFQGIDSVITLGAEALRADYGVSLGQHCSVFMAEVIAAAVADSVPKRSIIAGIYDSIIQNYLNRVKGSRSVGQVIFCQGMPFSADALAAAVARQTGAEVVIPPNPGTVGALGIALLTRKELDVAHAIPMDLTRFQKSQVVKKDVFICRSTNGCGGSGNKCRIDRISTVVDGKSKKFTWGGGCSLYDAGTAKKKLPNLTPDPFREREQIIRSLKENLGNGSQRPVVALTDEFVLKGLMPFFMTYLDRLGFDLQLHTGADQSILKRGIEGANVPFCAPMQQYHGIVGKMAESEPDYLFLPMVRNIPRIRDERKSRLCPIVQGSADILKLDIDLLPGCRLLTPVVNFGPGNMSSTLFKQSCEAIAEQMGRRKSWKQAFEAAVEAQESFDRECEDIGRRALEFCREKNITPVVVLGRAYTIYNKVLNSNVPTILREQGVLPIPVDCYPVEDGIPTFQNIYWGYGQRNLRAAEQIRTTEGIYSVYCSNYSCGPDSFNIHFYGYIMEGKPFAIIETDGHSGDAGTKTRLEAFLYCVREDLQREPSETKKNRFEKFDKQYEGLAEIRERNATVLIPRMGNTAKALAACLRGIGILAEALPVTQRDDLEEGRRHTSGKECVPMTLTLGALIRRLENEPDKKRHFSYFMPTSSGPCRFGTYNTLHKMVMERLGYNDRVGFWTPVDEDYFETVEDGFAAIVFAGFMASDLLLAALYDTRPLETQRGEAEDIYQYYHGQLMELLEREAAGDLSSPAVTAQVMSGNLWGISRLLRRAGQAFASIKGEGDIPSVVVVGEIYVRCDPFANGDVVRKLEQRGIRARFASFYEWIEYTDYQENPKRSASDYVASFLQATILQQTYRCMAELLDWPQRTTIHDAIHAAKPYIREELAGEAILTLGAPLHEWREGHIDGVVSVGPLECMPNKIAEAQYHHAAEQEGIVSLTLSLNGEPLDPEVLDNFAFEVKSEFERRTRGDEGRRSTYPPRASRRSWIPQSRTRLSD